MDFPQEDLDRKIREAEREAASTKIFLQNDPTLQQFKQQIHDIQRAVHEAVQSDPRASADERSASQHLLKWPAHDEFVLSAKACLSSIDHFMHALPWQSDNLKRHGRTVSVLREQLDQFQLSGMKSREEDVTRLPSQAAMDEGNVIMKASSFVSGGGCPPN